MTWTIEDPEAPPEAGANAMRAKDLKNLPLLIRPTGLGRFDPNEKSPDGDPYVACDVWVLDRAGIADRGSDVRFSWYAVYEVLKDKVGHLIGARPVEDGRRIILKALDGPAKEAAEKAVVELRAGSVKEALGGDEVDASQYDDSPF